MLVSMLFQSQMLPFRLPLAFWPIWPDLPYSKGDDCCSRSCFFVSLTNKYPFQLLFHWACYHSAPGSIASTCYGTDTGCSRCHSTVSLLLQPLVHTICSLFSRAEEQRPLCFEAKRSTHCASPWCKQPDL